MSNVGDRSVDQFYNDVGKRIKAMRIGAGMSQATLAKLIGFNRSSIANLEAGRQRIALHLFALIAEALDVDPEALLPNFDLLDEVHGSMIDVANENLEGALETTQDFVRGVMAQVSKTRREEG